jgi:hypothetical protein
VVDFKCFESNESFCFFFQKEARSFLKKENQKTSICHSGWASSWTGSGLGVIAMF